MPISHKAKSRCGRRNRGRHAEVIEKDNERLNCARNGDAPILSRPAGLRCILLDDCAHPVKKLLLEATVLKHAVQDRIRLRGTQVVLDDFKCGLLI